MFSSLLASTHGSIAGLLAMILVGALTGDSGAPVGKSSESRPPKELPLGAPCPNRLT